MQEYEVSLLKLFTYIMLDETISDKIRQLRFYAHKMLWGQKLGYADRLLNSIAEKKIAMIQKATTKTEIEKIIRPHAPHFNGVDFVADEYDRSHPSDSALCTEYHSSSSLDPRALHRFRERKALSKVRNIVNVIKTVIICCCCMSVSAFAQTSSNDGGSFTAYYSIQSSYMIWIPEDVSLNQQNYLKAELLNITADEQIVQ